MTLYRIPISEEEFIEVDTVTGMSQVRAFPSNDPIGNPYTTLEGELAAVQLRQEREAAQAEFLAWDASCLAVREDLTEALALSDLYPAPTPEETALIDTQVAAALAAYRSLANPPADIVGLAAAVVSWRSEL